MWSKTEEQPSRAAGGVWTVDGERSGVECMGDRAGRGAYDACRGRWSAPQGGAHPRPRRRRVGPSRGMRVGPWEQMKPVKPLEPSFLKGKKKTLLTSPANYIGEEAQILGVDSQTFTRGPIIIFYSGTNFLFPNKVFCIIRIIKKLFQNKRNLFCNKFYWITHVGRFIRLV